MLRRLWLTACVIGGCAGPALAAVIYLLGVQSLDAQLFDTEFDIASAAPTRTGRATLRIKLLDSGQEYEIPESEAFDAIQELEKRRVHFNAMKRPVGARESAFIPLDQLAATASEQQRPRVCWLSRFGLLTVRDAGGSSNPDRDDTPLASSDCIARLNSRLVELQKRERLAWLFVVLALTVVPLLSYGVYRWGLWIAGPTKTNDAIGVLRDGA